MGTKVPLLDSGARSLHRPWPLRTRHLDTPNQKLPFYGTQLTILAKMMDTPRYLSLRFPASASTMQDRPLHTVPKPSGRAAAIDVPNPRVLLDRSGNLSIVKYHRYWHTSLKLARRI